MEYDERLFEAVFNDPNLLVGVLDTDGTVEAVNDTALAYVGAAWDDIVGERFAETPWWSEDHREDVAEWVAAAANGEYVDYEVEHPTEDGAGMTVEGTFRPVTDDGTVIAVIASAKDVTERTERERALQERTEQLDRFASFVSHDLQSPISAVRGRLELALETGGREHIEKAMEAIERVDELRTDLVETLRTGEIVSETTDVNIAAALADAWRGTDPSGTATYEVKGTPRIEADPDAFQRLLENLVGNSVEHGGDDIHVLVGGFDDGFYYEDDGPGIDPEHRERVFVPGFSTKAGEEGIGMGMASVRQIVLAHDWEIHVGDAEELSGVRFEIHTDAGE